MNLDKTNFSNEYPQIVAQIKECDLIAFDLEYSGIKLRDQKNYSLFDTMEDRYQHIKSCAQSFTTFQLGIVLYTRRINEKTILLNNCSKFSSVTYNINLFPTGSDLFDTTFICSAAAMKFLRDHYMNFNDIIDKGVGFLNSEEFLQLKSKLDSYSNVHNVLTEEQEKNLETQRKCIINWLNDIKDNSLRETTFQMTLPCIEGLSPYFQQMFLRSHFTEISTCSTKDNKILVEKVNVGQRFEMDQKEEELSTSSEKYKFCMEMLGVSKIWKLISRLKKPVVGHNCLFDLITIYQKFFAPLPETFEEFRYELNKVLPTIYDTKFIFGRMRMNLKELAEINGGLESVFQALYEINQNNKEVAVNIEEQSVSVDEDRSHSLSFVTEMSTVLNRVSSVSGTAATSFRSCQAHEAGYDAFMTGSCLIYLANILYKSQLQVAPGAPTTKKPTSDIGTYEKTSKKTGSIAVASFETYENFLKPWRNYVNVIRAHEFCVCFDKTAIDDGFRTACGNKLMDTRPPYLIVYDRDPLNELLPNADDLIAEDIALTEDDDNSSGLDSTSESFFSQAFLENLLFEFGDADIKKFGKIHENEKYQKFMVALPSYNITRSFIKSTRKRWPRLVVREYSKLKDDRLSRICLLGTTGLSTVVSAWSLITLAREIRSMF